MKCGIPVKGSESGRFQRTAEWAARGALPLALTACVPFFLKYLLACESEGKRPLFQLSRPITGLSWVGEQLSRFAENHPLALPLVFSLVVLPLALIPKPQERQSQGEQERGDLNEAVRRPHDFWFLLGGMTLLVLNAALFLSKRYALACFGGVAAAVLLWLGGWLELSRTPRSSHFLWILPVGLAAVLRFYALGEVPGGVATHAVAHHLNSTIQYKETLLPLFRQGHLLEAAKATGSALRGDHFGLMSILAAIGFEGLGVGFLSARLLSALAGTLTVVGAYLMGRALEDERTGFFFAFLLAISPWHLTVSRYPDLEHVLSPLQLVAALGLYAAAIQSGGVAYYALAAAAVGLSWYVYAPNQVLPLAVALHLGAMLAFRRGYLRRHWWKVVLFGIVVAGMAGGPIRALVQGRFAATTGYEGSALPFRDLPRLGHMLVAAGRQLFVQSRDEWFSKPGGGLSLTEAALFLPAFLLCVIGLFVPERRWTSALIVLLVPITLIPGVLAPDESFRRFYPTATLAIFMAASMLSRSTQAAHRIGLQPRAIAGIGLAFMAGLASINVDIYLNKATIHTEESAVFLTEMAKQVKESFGKEFTYVYQTPRTEVGDYYSSIRFALYHELRELERRGGTQEDCCRVLLAGELFWVLPEPRRIDGMTRFLAEEAPPGGPQTDVNVCAAISEAYPEAEEEAYRDRRGTVVMRSWRIRAPLP